MPNLAQIRQQKTQLTATELARQAGMSQGYLSHLENGTRRITSISAEKLAGVLKVSSSEIVKAAEESRHSNAQPKSWILKIHIDGRPILRAFKDYLELNPDKDSSSFMAWVLDRFEESFKAEMKFSGLGGYIQRRMKDE